MEQNTLDNKFYYYLFYALSATIAILSIISYNEYLIILSSLLLLTAAILLHSGHIVNNALIKRSKIIEINNGYRLNQNLTSASKRIGKTYVSIAIAIIRPRSGFNYKSEAMKELLESVKEPFELSISLSEVDKKRIIDSLETKRRVKEIAMSRLKSNSYDKINNLKRHIELIDNEMANISAGGKSFDVSIRLTAISKSDSAYESELSASKNIEMLANKFSASMGVDYEIVKGEELFNFI
jgi:hypothetical protein